MVDKRVIEELLNITMAQILALPDEQMKKESTEQMAILVRTIGSTLSYLQTRSVSPKHMDPFYLFWFNNTIKFMNSSSLVFKLAAWEQLNEIIHEAKVVRPVASSYLVEGAGTTFVNGEYVLCPRVGEDYIYKKVPTQPNMPLLTLFKCSMRSKEKWWFISQADLDKPGTDKDIDYYLHRSTAEEDKEPAFRGWTHVTQGINLIGVVPPPSVKRKSLDLPKDTTKEMYLDYKLLGWTLNKDLLSYIYGSSIHREIVSRSGKFIIFLAEYDALKKEHISLIWKSAINSQEIGIVEEIFSQLVPLTMYLSDALFSHLMVLALEALKEDTNYNKVAIFVERFNMNHNKYLLSAIKSTSPTSLVSLIWEIYKNPSFENLKGCNAIQDILSIGFSQKDKSNMVYQRIQDCIATLSSLSKTSETGTDEQIASRIIQILTFFICKPMLDNDLVAKLMEVGFPAIIVSEIKRFVYFSREKIAAKQLDEKTFSSLLASRLKILRRFFTTNRNVTIPYELVEQLWSFLSQQYIESEEFFTFLKNSFSVGNADNAPSDVICSPENCMKIFKNIICSPAIDWGHCGDAAFECFHGYFNDLEGSESSYLPGTELPPKLGLATLWNIALKIPTPSAMKDSIDLLLQAFDMLSYSSADANNIMLRHVFSHLKSAIQNASQIQEREALISRCIAILHTAVIKTKGPANIHSHAMRGCMSRITISVYYRKVTSYYNQNTQSDIIRVEKGTDGIAKLEVHPYHTFAMLKEKLYTYIGLNVNLNSVSFTVENIGKAFVNDSTRLLELGLKDGGEISLSYIIQYNQKSYDDDNSFYGTSDDRNIHIGRLISGDESYMDCLLTLCEYCGPDVVKQIWELCMLIPSQQDWMQLVMDTAQTSMPSTDEINSWGMLMANWSIARTTYFLQIVDSYLQPSPEMVGTFDVDSDNLLKKFKVLFLTTGGFSMVLNVLINTPTNDALITSAALGVSLHIIHHVLEESNLLAGSSESSGESKDLEKLDNIQKLPYFNGVLRQIEAQSSSVIEKLLFIARNAAANEESGIVQNALVIINTLIKSPEVAHQLTTNPQSKMLLAKVLRSGSKKVRSMAEEFAVQVGKSQPVVLTWLLEELRDMNFDDDLCTEVFRALTALLIASVGSDLKENTPTLARILSQKILSYPRDGIIAGEDRFALCGYLDLLDNLISLDHVAVEDTELGANLIQVLLSDFLFTMPNAEDNERRAICDTPLSRQSAYNVISTFVKVSPSAYEQVLAELTQLTALASRRMNSFWGLQVSYDIKKSDLNFLGLKNQGCTCYMNSLLQQLFMNTTLRDSILKTQLKESQRTTVWHRSDEDLVGNVLLFEFANGSWRAGKVLEYDSYRSAHRIQYMHVDGSAEEIALFDIHEGRHGKETGKVRFLPSSNSPSAPITESDDAAYRVFEQLQRTFCFLKYSKKRYFDPRPFVEACKTLNMNFNVYHQNDAAEFCDQLLDRIETSTKGKHSGKDVWNEVFMKEVFGGKWLYQKIPRDCQAYTMNKADCGHWQGSRLESYLKVELIIRGKDNIDDSLGELMQGELMDGDNKIHCDVCSEKKATVRRTCFGNLPNTMILHLKRFDLDFQTFETVKLNNRMAFNTRINMLKYTKEGIEAEEKKSAKVAEQQDQSNVDKSVSALDSPGSSRDQLGLSAPSQESESEAGISLDVEEYDYELQGVLVHAGVAQGGHYYSYVKDATSDSNKWYKFDDEDVSPFNSETIPASCFGGPPSANLASHNSHNQSMNEEDRISNALMLFYNKVKKPSPSEQQQQQSLGDGQVAACAIVQTTEGDRLVDGIQAFQREVQEANMQHILSCYLLDSDLHNFVRALLALLSQSDVAGSAENSFTSEDSLSSFQEKLLWKPEDMNDDLPLRTVKFGCEFLLDVVLHCRERASMRSSVNVLRSCFEKYPHTALWFLHRVVDTQSCGWFLDYLFYCTDALARATFVQILVQAVHIVAPTTAEALVSMKNFKLMDLKSEIRSNPAALVSYLLKLVVESSVKVVNHVRTADEYFTLVRDLCSIPSVCTAFQHLAMVSILAYFITPDSASPQLKNMFEKHLVVNSRQNAMRVDYGNLLQSVFEALAALLGVPQVRKVNLLQERSYWDSELVPEAKDVLTTIFKESSHNMGMDANFISAYFDRVTNFGSTPGQPLHKATPVQVRNILDRFANTADGRLSLEGFLQYQTDTASHNPKLVWRVSIFSHNVLYCLCGLSILLLLSFFCSIQDLHAFHFRNDLSRVVPINRAGGATAQSAAPNTSAEANARPSVAGAEDGSVVNRGSFRSSLSDFCRHALSNITLYEAGLSASEACAKAIAQAVCSGDETISKNLIQQVTRKGLSNNNYILFSNDNYRLLGHDKAVCYRH